MSLPQTGYVLDLNANQRTNGRPVDIAPYNGTSAQFWTLVYTGQNGWYEIQLTGSNPVMCLDKPSQSNANGTTIQIWQCNGQPQQLWTPYGIELINQQAGKCLDAPLLNFNNPYVEIWDCNAGMNQDWARP